MKNALLIVLAFALGGGAMWFFMSDDASTGAPAANAGGRPGGGGFGAGGGRPGAQLPLVTVGRARKDKLYDFIVEIDHNAGPRIAGRGSAVFLHLARHNFSPTAGCVSVGQLYAGCGVFCGSSYRAGPANRVPGPV